MNAASKSVRSAVIGTGAMGRGIAQILALGGHTDGLYDQQADAVSNAIESLRKVFARLVEKGKLPAAEAEQALNRLQPVAKLEDLSESELVIEAILEKLEVKQTLFQSL